MVNAVVKAEVPPDSVHSNQNSYRKFKGPGTDYIRVPKARPRVACYRTAKHLFAGQMEEPRQPWKLYLLRGSIICSCSRELGMTICLKVKTRLWGTSLNSVLGPSVI